MIGYKEYEQAIRDARAEPNFFVSAAYFAAAGWVVEKRDGVFEVRDSDGQLMLPPVSGRGLLRARPAYGFPGYDGDGDGPGDFWDVQYVYDPTKVASLQGHRRQVFRKNVRRFVREVSDVEYRPPRALSEVALAAERWMKLGQELYDLDVLIQFIEAPLGQQSRVMLIGKDVVGANIWDENWRHVNYRYAFHDRKMPRLSEYLRWSLYNEIGRHSKKMVNDGGDLGLPALRRFKEKLGPDRRDEIESWI